MKGNKGLLASMVVFRNLYDDENADIYKMIAMIVKEEIIEERLYEFDIHKITDSVNEKYNFEIPKAVVKSSIKRLENITLKNGRYNVEPDYYKKTDLNSKIANDWEKSERSAGEIIDSLFDFIESKKLYSVEGENKQFIVEKFCEFILNKELKDHYTNVFSAFIMKNKGNIEFMESLKKIREGVILYEGLKYNPNINEINSWNTSLTLYLETEIIFSIAGLNGELFKLLTQDFLKYINEINTKFKNDKSKERIKLRYFSETKEEIENYYSKAELILKNKVVQDNSKTAMRLILEQCKKTSDVLALKNKLFCMLEKMGIMEFYSPDCNSEDYKRYNLESEDLHLELEKKLKKDFGKNLKLVNYINILRKNRNDCGFDRIEHVLVSGNNTTWKIAWDERIRADKDVPLATTVDFLTNKFWFKLNKGFGGQDLPHNIDMIMKAQMILSSQINGSLYEEYKKIEKMHTDGTISKEEVKGIYLDLKSKAYLPEEISEENTDEILELLNQNSIEKYITEKEIQERKNKQLELEKESKINSMEEEIERLKEEGKDKGALERKIVEVEQKMERINLQSIDKDQRIKEYEKKERRTKIVSTVVFFIAMCIFWPDVTAWIGSTLSIILTIAGFFGINYKGVLEFLGKEKAA